MTNSSSNREAVYAREADFFDQDEIESRQKLDFLYGGFGIRIALECFYNFARPIEHRRILEYGCGDGWNLFNLAKQRASAVGIELSQRSVARSNQLLIAQNVSPTQAIAMPMNAERLGFGNDSFDIIMGTAILHHLDLHLALAEIRRVLKAGGMAVFLEARGDNGFIDIYRKLTPSQRTSDEHPLICSDFDLLDDYFEEVDIVGFYFIALFSFLLRKVWKNEKVFVALNKTLVRLDQKLITIFPFLERFCWIAVIRLKKLNKSM
jgi:SAM-dependent methyltransferase